METARSHLDIYKHCFVPSPSTIYHSPELSLEIDQGRLPKSTTHGDHQVRLLAILQCPVHGRQVSAISRLVSTASQLDSKEAHGFSAPASRVLFGIVPPLNNAHIHTCRFRKLAATSRRSTSVAGQPLPLQINTSYAPWKREASLCIAVLLN